MTNLSQVKSIFTSLVSSTLGSFGGVIIKDNKDTPKANLFIRIAIINVSDLMLKPIVFTNPDGTKRVIFSKRATFSLNSYGPEAVDILYDLQNKLQLPSTGDLFQESNIALRDQGTIKDLPLEEADSKKQHGNLQLTIDFKDELIDDVGYFDKVQINGEFISFKTQIITTSNTITSL